MTEPVGNRLYLVCDAHTDTDHALMLGQRRGAEYSKAPSAGHLNDWFEKHLHCSPGLDHFKLAHAKSPNWDHAVMADGIPKAVKLALVS